MTLELFNLNLRACVDADLGQLCADSCQEKLENCTEFCEDPNCTSRCQGEWLDCLSSCPCYSGCPEGCKDCPNPICGSPLRHLFVIDERMSEWNKGMHWNSYTDEIEFRNFAYQFNHGFDIEDTCYAMLNGEHWLLGGWFYPNAIAKVEDCKISRQKESLEVPFHGGMFGSCTVYNSKIWTCFDGKEGRAQECYTFDGEQQEEVPHISARGHDWGAMGMGQIFKAFLNF